MKIFRALAVIFAIWADAEVLAAPPPPLDYPLSFEQELKTLLSTNAETSSDPNILIRLAGLYLDMGNDLFTDKAKRLAAYEERVRIAGRVFELKEPCRR